MRDEIMMNHPDNPRRSFETTDLNLASFLRSRSFEIADIKRQNTKTVFVFDDSPELHRAILDFANDGAVGVRSFCNTVRDLKAITR
ncbi:MAG: DUF5659 domain-containing protein [Blastocatellia bacterium]